MLTFSRLTEKEIEAVSRIEEETFSMPWKPQDFLDMISHDYAYYIVALLDDVPIGCCGIINACGDGDISNVVIKEEYRNKGYGEQMLRYLMEQSRELGVENYTLEVRASNTAAISLYKKLGFLECGVRKNFYEKPTEDGLIMWYRPSES